MIKQLEKVTQERDLYKVKAEESQVQTAEEGKVLTEKIHMNRTLNCKLDILVKTVTAF